MSRVPSSLVDFVRPTGVDEGAVVSVFRVPPEVAGQRLDVFVCGQMRRVSRTRAQAIVRASAYDVAGRRLRPNDRVYAEQHVLLWRAPWDEGPSPVDVGVVYEDDHLLAVDKPPLMAVHPSARYHGSTLIKVLQAARPEAPFLSLGHRLDRETSGVLLVSKTRDCDRALKKLLERRTGVTKTYVAMTWGVPDRGDGAPSFRYERRMAIDPVHPLKVKMCIHDSPDALYAATAFEVKEVLRRARPLADGSGTSEQTYALVRCGLETGRQHQIRVHLASLGAPIVGDKLYGPDDTAFARSSDNALTAEDVARLELPRQALHALRIEMPHPITGAPFAAEAPLPADMASFWASLAG